MKKIIWIFVFSCLSQSVFCMDLEEDHQGWRSPLSFIKAASHKINTAKKNFSEISPRTKIALGTGLFMLSEVLEGSSQQIIFAWGCQLCIDASFDLSERFVRSVRSRLDTPKTKKHCRKRKEKNPRFPQEEKIEEDPPSDRYKQKIFSVFCHSANLFTNFYLFTQYLYQLDSFYEKEISPLGLHFPEGAGHCSGILCMPITTPAMLAITGCGFFYNLKELLHMYQTGEVHQNDRPVFGALNGLAISHTGHLFDYLSKPFNCRQLIRGDLTLEDIDATFGEETAFEFAAFCLNSAFQVSFSSKVMFSYGHWIYLKNILRVCKNSITLIYETFENRKSAKRLADLHIERERLLKTTRTKTRATTNKRKKKKRPHRFGQADAARWKIRPPYSRSPSHANKIFGLSRKNLQKERKGPKIKTRGTPWNLEEKAVETEQQAITFDDFDFQKIDLIETIFYIQRYQKTLGKNNMHGLAKDIAHVLIKGKSYFENNYLKISWEAHDNYKKTAYFETAHPDPKYQDWKLRKALSACLLTLIYDWEEAKLDLYQNQLSKRSSVWDFVRDSLLKR